MLALHGEEDSHASGYLVFAFRSRDRASIHDLTVRSAPHQYSAGKDDIPKQTHSFSKEHALIRLSFAKPASRAGRFATAMILQKPSKVHIGKLDSANAHVLWHSPLILPGRIGGCDSCMWLMGSRCNADWQPPPGKDENIN